MKSRELHSTLPTGRVRVLDVRTASEFDNAHIEGAYNVPLAQLSEHAAELTDGTNGAIVLLCQSGQRAQKAEALLREAGFANAHVLEGGMRAWIAEGYPIKRIRARVSIERQVRIAAGGIVALGSVAALVASVWLALVPLAVGMGLVFAGISDTCAMGMVLARLPYNRTATSCDTESIVRRFLAEDEVSRQ